MKAILILALTAVASIAFAENSPIEVQNPKVYAPLKGSNATAGYATVRNLTDKQIVITIVGADGFKAAEMHETTSKDGKMSMQKINQVTLPAKTNFDFSPGANHIMLFDSTRAMKEGDETQITFNVDGKPSKVKFKIVARPTGEEDHAHHH